MRGRSRLPVPDLTGIYTFPDMILKTHSEWQDRLNLIANGTEPRMELIAPLNGHRYLIAPRSPTGRPILAIEPHHDDLVLSAGGYLLRSGRPLTVATVFTRSASVHPAVKRYSSVDEVSQLRAAESHQAFQPLRARHHLIGMKDAEPPYVAYDPRRVDYCVEALRPFLCENPDSELLTPAGVTRHPDHLLVHEAAWRLGCRWFWDDTAFYPTYAANVDDQLLFELRTGGRFVIHAEDITEVLLDKLTLLHMYQSQMQPVREMYRVLRYNWTVATQLMTEESNSDLGRFAERFFRARLGPG